MFAHIRALQKKSILQRSSKARSISLVKQHRKTRVPAGARTVPVYEAESIASAKTPRSGQDLVCDSKLFRKTLGGKDVFAMRVNGKDMENMGIRSGDMLLVRTPSGSIMTGDLLLTVENGKPALRSCRRCEDGKFELHSGDPRKQNILAYQNDIPLKGVVVGLQRSL